MGASVLATEHAELVDSAISLVANLEVARERLRPGDAMWLPHVEFAERSWMLAQHLAAALLLTDHDRYVQSFVTIRTALEHHVQDHLLFLGNRYRAIAVDVSDDDLAEWQAAIAEGRSEFAGILELRRLDRTRIEVVRTGPHFTGQEQGPDAPALSIYYQVMNAYGPFTGGKKAQPYIGQWAHSEDAHRRWAAQASETWGRFFTWAQLVGNLELNGFYSPRELARFNVHYSFLSAFTHATTAAFQTVLGRNTPMRMRYDHYASELILLYVMTIARLELETFEEMAKREPVVALAEWDAVRNDLDRGKTLAQHLWFPTDPPHIYDRVQEANRRGFDREGKPVVDRPRPEDLADEDVMYYVHPLKRMVALHAGVNEWTGFQYITPWPRRDAQTRLLD